MSIRSKGWKKHLASWQYEQLPEFPKPASSKRKCGYCKLVPEPAHNSLTCPLRLSVEKPGRRGAPKKPLMSLNNRGQGKERIKELVDFFDKYCDINQEDKKDVMCVLLLVLIGSRKRRF